MTATDVLHQWTGVVGPDIAGTIQVEGLHSANVKYQ